MKKQYAVFGLGSFGESVAVTLQSLGCEVVAVDNHMERIEEIANKVSYAMKANVGDPEVIRSVGARNLDGVVVATADDMEASVMATLVSKELGVQEWRKTWWPPILQTGSPCPMITVL